MSLDGDGESSYAGVVGPCAAVVLDTNGCATPVPDDDDGDDDSNDDNDDTTQPNGVMTTVQLLAMIRATAFGSLLYCTVV